MQGLDKKYKIGVWVNGEGLPTQGGGYYYGRKLLQKLNEYSSDNNNFEICFIGYNLTQKYNKSIVVLKKFKRYRLEKIPFIGHKVRDYRKRKYETSCISQLENEKVKLIFYPSPEVEFENFPFILNNWDIGHKSMYAFPEVSNERQFFKREKFYKEIVSRALFVCVESGAGKEELTKYYNINPDRIKILPIFSGEVTDETIIESRPAELNNGDEFLFYPAQFWAHKNHYNLILAFNSLIKTNIKLKLVFTGSNKGNLNYLIELVRNLNLTDRILFLSFREIGEIKWLYKNAKALVMPTFLGPTNMPIIEALELNCPVVCSDLKGHREILGENGIYFDPANYMDMAKKIEHSINREMLIKNETVFNVNNTLEVFISIMEESIPIRNCWN